MNCKACGSKLKTMETRSTPYGVRRRHKCEACGYRVTSVEIPMDEYKYLVGLIKASKEAKEKLNDACGALNCIVEKGGAE